jgi:hypothetical protein
MDPGEPLTTAVEIRERGRNPPGATSIRVVKVCPPPEGAPGALPVSQVCALTTITSPLAGVNDAEVRTAEVPPDCPDRW